MKKKKSDIVETTLKEKVDVTTQRLQELEQAVLQKHTQRGGVALDILKSVVSEQLNQISMRAVDFSQLIQSVYVLADMFKDELDRRYKVDLEATQKSVMGGDVEAEPTFDAVEDAFPTVN